MLQPKWSSLILWALMLTLYNRLKFCDAGAARIYMKPMWIRGTLQEEKNSLYFFSSTLSGLSSCSLNQLQKVQNKAARLVLRKQKLDHITPLLEKLHWLPVEAHIHYKIATLAFRHFENSLPSYLSELLRTYQPSQSLWSSSEKLLKVPKTNLKSAGNRSFHFRAAKIWNSLPTNVRSSPSLSSFEKNLKTHLFKERFSLVLWNTFAAQSDYWVDVWMQRRWC